MQIRMFTENNIHITAGKAAQMKQQSAQALGDGFGPQCKVTISREGRKLSEQSKTQTVRSAQSIKAEKIMLRQQEQSEQAEDTKNEYLELLEEINKTIKSLNGSFRAGEDEETILKKQQVLRAMREQKQKQLEENQKKQKEAQQMAMQSSEAQEEIDKNNRDLLVMLKSIEASEKAEEEEQEKNGGGSTEGGSNGVRTENSVSDVIQNAASQFTASSIKRELNVVGMIDALNEDGHNYLAKADEIVRNALDEAESLKELLADENYTDAEKEEAVSRYRVKVMGSYSDLSTYRRRGLQLIKDSKDAKIQHIADNPLQGMEETKESMMRSAVDAAINEASQSKLDETSKELQDEVEELIDKRNDADHVETDEEKAQEEQSEAIGENIKAADGEE